MCVGVLCIMRGCIVMAFGLVSLCPHITDALNDMFLLQSTA